MPAASLTVIPGASGSGTQDANLLADGQILFADPDVGANTISSGALAAVPAATNILVQATGTITFNDLGGVLTLQTGAGTTATFSTAIAGGGGISFANATNTLATSGGDLGFTAQTDLTLANLSAPGGTVTLTATAGAILDGNVTATNLAMTAATGVGQGGNPIETTVINLEAETTTGGIFVSNTGSLTVGVVSAALRGLRVATSGDIAVTASGSIVLNDGNGIETVRSGSASGGVFLTAVGATSDVISIINQDAISAPGGGISVFAGRDIGLGIGGVDFDNDVRASGNVAFGAGRDITLDGFSDVVSDDFGLNTGGSVVFTAGRHITVAAVNGTDAGVAASGTAGGDVTLTAGPGGVVTVDPPGSFAFEQLVSTSGDVTINADAVAINPASRISAGSGVVTIRPVTAGTLIDLGGPDAAGTLGLTGGELDTVSAPVLRILDLAGGNISVTAAVGVGNNVPILSLISSGIISATAAGSLSVGALRVSSPNGVSLNGGANNVNSLAGTVTTAAADFAFRDANGFVIGTVDGVLGITISADPGSLITLNAGGPVTQTAGADVFGNALELLGAGSYTLINASNDVAILSANLTAAGTGTLRYTDADALQVGVAGATIGVTTNDSNVSITAGDNFLQVRNDDGDASPDLDAGAGAVTLAVVSSGGDDNLLEIQANAGVVGTGGVTLTADLMSIGATVDAGASTATLQPFQAGTPIDLGTETAGQLSLTDAEIDLVTAGLIQVGAADSGDLTVTAPIGPANSPALFLRSGGVVTDAVAGGLLVNSVGALAGTGVVLDSAASTFASFEAETDTGGITVVRTGSVTIGGLGAALRGLRVATSGDITVTAATIILSDNDGPQTVGGSTSGNVSLNAIGANSDVISNIDRDSINAPGGDITVTAGRDIGFGIIGSNFDNDVRANGSVFFTAGRDIILDGFSDVVSDDFGQATGGSVVFTAGRNITLAVVSGTDAGIAANGVVNGGDVTLTAGPGGVVTVDPPGSLGFEQLLSRSGDVTINADAVAINPASRISAGSGVVTIQPVTAGTLIDLGGPDAAGTLGLTDAELDTVFATALRIGDAATTGTITVTAPISPGALSPPLLASLSLRTAGAVVDGTAAEGPDITVARLAVLAGAGIGAADDLDIAVANLSFNNTAGAVNINNTGSGANEVQEVTVSGASGTFTLTFNGQTTPALPFDVTASAVQVALNALPSIGGVGGVVSVVLNGGAFTVTFGGTLGGQNQPQITASVQGATSVIINTVQNGSASLTIADVAGSGPSTNTGTTTNVATSGGLVFAVNATTAGTTAYTAGDTAAVGVDILVVNPGVTVEATAGSLALQSGDEVFLLPGSTARASGAVQLNVGFGDLDGFGGATIQGTIDAGSGTPVVLGGTEVDTVAIDFPLGANLPDGLNYQAGGGSDTLIVSDSGDTAAHAYAISGAGVTRDGSAFGTTGVEVVNVHGGDASDTFNITPAVITTFNIVGNDPASTAPGDTLDVTLAGTTNPLLTATSDASGLAGSYTFGNRQPVNFQEVETILDQVDVSVTKTNGLTTLVPGSTVTYTVVVSNTGGLGIAGVVVGDLFPGELAGVTYTSSAGGGASGNTAAGAGNINDTLSLPAGSSVTYTASGTVSLTATSLSNTATVTTPAGVGDANPGDNSATDAEGLAAAELAVTVTDSPSPVAAGTNLTYTITVTNSGPGEARTVQLTGAVPANTTFVSFTAPSGWTADTPAAGGTGTITATLPSFAVGGSAVFTLVVRVNTAVPASTVLTNTAAVSAATPDPTPGNDSAARQTRVAGAILPIVVGAGAGSARVRVFDPATLAETRSFVAYPGFDGRVRVAAGDVTGDGVADIITGAGPGGAAHVKVFDGATGAEVRSFFAYAPGFLGGVFVAAGDVDGDGFADVVTGAGAGAGSHVKVFSGATGAELQSFFAFAPDFLGGVTVAAADLDGDGRDEVVTGASDGGSAHVKVFDPAARERASFFAFDSVTRGGVFVAAGDLDGDGRAEVIAGNGQAAAEVKTFVFGGGGVARGAVIAQDPEAFRQGTRVAVADRGADGQLDVVTGAGPGGPPLVQIFNGRTLEQLDRFEAFEAGVTGGVFVG